MHTHNTHTCTKYIIMWGTFASASIRTYNCDPLLVILGQTDVSIVHLLVLNSLGQGKKLDKNIMMDVGGGGGACA